MTDTRYEYDAAGNRTKKTVTTQAGVDITTYSYDSADRLMQESTSLAAGGNRVVSYTYDGNGNRASKTEPGLVTLYRFDPQNRLIDIRTGATQAEAQAAAPGVSYAYDANGNRIRKATPQTTATYLIDASQPYAQVALETKARTGTGAESTAYVWGEQLIRQTKAAGTTVFGSGAAGDDIYPLQGHLGTSLGTVDAIGNLVEQTNADAFGNLDQLTGLKQSHLYVGEYFDTDSQLLYLRARWYDPKIGQFIGADPFEGKQGNPKSLNRYSYVHGDPVHGRDPTGGTTLGEVGAASDVATTLGSLQANFGFDLISSALDGGGSGDSASGWGILASLAPAAIGQLAKKAFTITSKMGSRGKVAYPKGKPPLPKEIEAAEFIAEKQGVGIYIRGGSSTKGADFFIGGAKWELKTLDQPTSTAVKTSIRDGKKQANKVVIDGRAAGLTEEEARRGLARSVGSGGTMPDEIMIILKDGKMLLWP